MRMNLFSSTVLAGIALTVPTVFGLPSSFPPSPYKVFEKLAEVPEGWTEVPTRINMDKMMTLRINLAQQNVAAFEQKVMDLSTPDHVSYGEHMSHHDIKRMLQPTENTVSIVFSWLDSFGLGEKAVKENDSIKVNVTLAQAQEMLQTEYKYYRHVEDKTMVLRTLKYSLPESLHEHVMMVQPTTMFGMRPLRSLIHKIVDAPVRKGGVFPSALRTQFNVSADCNYAITPACLRALYNFEEYKPSAKNGSNQLGVSGFLGQFAQYDDLNLFLQQYDQRSIGANFSFQSVNGGLNTQDPPNIGDITEANLDIQYTVSLSYPTPNIYFSTPGRPPFVPDLDVTTSDSEPYLEYLTWLLKQKKIPQTITTSYGENEQSVPLSYRKTTCNLFAQLGARGTSVLFSSGDSGPGWSCRTNDGKNSTRFLPTYPASCPFVTAVGGTHGVSPEQAVYFSSGGFSDTWPMPAYQKAAVTSYFEKHPEAWKPWKKYFNKAGRGIPDVATQGSNYHVIIAERDALVGGTSASAPTFGAIVSLLNDNRISQGKPPLGFLNPWLYSTKTAATFTDITHGRSTGCDGTRSGSPIPGGPGVIKGAGWDAVSGWDPVTGLGTPDFVKLKETCE